MTEFTIAVIRSYSSFKVQQRVRTSSNSDVRSVGKSDFVDDTGWLSCRAVFALKTIIHLRFLYTV